MGETIKNLLRAFIGECIARNVYTMFAKVADEEGYHVVAAAFRETADNEKEHAITLLYLIKEMGGQPRVTVEVEVPSFGDTIRNLEAAIKGETYEYTEMYPRFAEVAEREGYPAVAATLRAIASAEKHHSEMFRGILERLKEGTLFKRGEEILWICTECGYVHREREPPERCPSCGHPKGFFKPLAEEV